MYLLISPLPLIPSHKGRGNRIWHQILDPLFSTLPKNLVAFKSGDLNQKVNEGQKIPLSLDGRGLG
jgi:hypothetical protein